MTKEQFVEAVDRIDCGCFSTIQFCQRPAPSVQAMDIAICFGLIKLTTLISENNLLLT